MKMVLTRCGVGKFSIVAVLLISGTVTVSGNPLTIQISPNPAKHRDAVTITCTREKNYHPNRSLQWTRQTGNLRLSVAVDNFLTSEFESYGWTLVKAPTPLSDAHEDYILTIHSADYHDTANITCSILKRNESAITASAQLTVCDDPGNSLCDCIERERYPMFRCTDDIGKAEVKQYRATVIALAILFVIVVVYAVIVSILFARDFIKATHEKARKKLDKLRLTKEHSAMDNRGFDDSVASEHAQIVNALLKEREMEAKIKGYDLNNAYNLDKEMAEAIEASHRSTPEGQSSTGSFNGNEQVQSLAGMGAMTSKDNRSKAKRSAPQDTQNNVYSQQGGQPGQQQGDVRQANPRHAQSGQAERQRRPREERPPQPRQQSNAPEPYSSNTYANTGANRDYYDQVRNLSMSQSSLASPQAMSVAADVHRHRERSQERDYYGQSPRAAHPPAGASRQPDARPNTLAVPNTRAGGQSRDHSPHSPVSPNQRMLGRANASPQSPGGQYYNAPHYQPYDVPRQANPGHRQHISDTLEQDTVI